MRHRTPTDDQDRLADRLRRDAQVTRPEFSQELHERIRQVVQQDDMSPVRRSSRAHWQQYLAPLTVAAALLLAVSFTAWWFGQRANDGPAGAEIADSAACYEGAEQDEGRLEEGLVVPTEKTERPSHVYALLLLRERRPVLVWFAQTSPRSTSPHMEPTMYPR